MEDKVFLKDLSKYGLLKEYLKSKILENKIQNIQLNKEEFSSAKKNYMRFFGLKDDVSLEKHRLSNILSIENLFYKITLFTKVQKYCDIHYSKYISKNL